MWRTAEQFLREQGKRVDEFIVQWWFWLPVLCEQKDRYTAQSYGDAKAGLVGVQVEGKKHQK